MESFRKILPQLLHIALTAVAGVRTGKSAENLSEYFWIFSTRSAVGNRKQILYFYQISDRSKFHFSVFSSLLPEYCGFLPPFFRVNGTIYFPVSPHCIEQSSDTSVLYLQCQI